MSAAWKAERILANATRIVAIELLAAAQGLEYLKPLRPGRGVAESYAAVRGAAPPLHGDRPLTADIGRGAAGAFRGKVRAGADMRAPELAPGPRGPHPPCRRGVAGTP